MINVSVTLLLRNSRFNFWSRFDYRNFRQKKILTFKFSICYVLNSKNLHTHISSRLSPLRGVGREQYMIRSLHTAVASTFIHRFIHARLSLKHHKVNHDK